MITQGRGRVQRLSDTPICSQMHIIESSTTFSHASLMLITNALHVRMIYVCVVARKLQLQHDHLRPFFVALLKLENTMVKRHVTTL